ncbi:hypothetical protein EVAR_47564_1 [Eumeta japonica]|uniref:Uncharacterized protein n=1 Tax=Eumeta variegata TaxID=151549 RepID=A0A4C1WRH1_EUMVA|nr:hypothetical protein EVAR_47564_1 [Eumeta japonica]
MRPTLSTCRLFDALSPILAHVAQSSSKTDQHSGRGGPDRVAIDDRRSLQPAFTVMVHDFAGKANRLRRLLHQVQGLRGPPLDLGTRSRPCADRSGAPVTVDRAACLPPRRDKLQRRALADIPNWQNQAAANIEGIAMPHLLTRIQASGFAAVARLRLSRQRSAHFAPSPIARQHLPAARICRNPDAPDSPATSATGQALFLPNPTRPRQSLRYGSDFPYLHYSIDQDSSPWRPAADMGTNRRDISAYVPHLNSSPPGPRWVFATTTKICTDGAPGGLTPRPFCALRRARPTRYGLMTARFKRAVARPVTVEYRQNASAPSISGLVASAGELLHSLADSDFHGHRPAVLSDQRLSWCPMSVLGALTLRSVHPTAPVLLTKIGPLGTVIRSRGFIVRVSPSSHHLKFENSICARSAPSSAVWERDASGCETRTEIRVHPPRAFQKIETPLHFRYAFQFDRYTRRLNDSHMLDSLVRVSRRVLRVPKPNHRRRIRARSETTAAVSMQARSVEVRTRAEPRTRRRLASGLTRLSACAFRIHTVRLEGRSATVAVRRPS